jgi:PAS domain S-box-containing protein
MTGPTDLPAAELIGLSEYPIALFDADGLLRETNSAFASDLRPVVEFLRPGTPWSLLLNEIYRHAVLPSETCYALRVIEERLMDSTDAHPVVEGALSGGALVSIRLTATSDGGFAMTLGPGQGPEADRSESEVEQLMAKVLEACPASLTMARIGDGKILYRSPAATELLGKGKNTTDHFALRTERADFITALLPNARVDDMRVTGRRADGSDFPAAISARLIDYRGEDVVVSTMDDLTDEIAMQGELARQKDQVFQAEKMSALGELLAGVAHELNNPLSIIVGNAHILLEEEEDQALLARVGKLSDAAERCVRIVKTFLSMARDRPLEVSPVSVKLLIDTAIEAYQAGQTISDLSIEVDIPDDLPVLLIDEVQITQVLSNLLINADHAIADHGGVGRVRISAQPLKDRVRIRLADDGPGVPDDIAGRIFDPLFTTKTGGKGTGVGLALCHRIAMAHGGAIVLDTSYTQGACFLIDLPVGQA